MSRELDQSKPFSKEDIQWCKDWSLDHLVAENERRHGQSKVHADGDPVDVNKAFDKAGVEVPDAPPAPSYVGAMGGVQQGPLIVEGETNEGRVPLPRDHPLTQEVVEGEGTGVPDAFEEVDIDELNVDELKDNLRDLGESTSGNKDELRKRLRKALG